MRADIYHLFKECDRNGNDSLDRHELYKALKLVGLNPSPRELNELFDLIDKNHDDKIDYREFEKVML